MSELVSVIINVYNCKEYLPYSLESVRQQTYKNLEVILVDDASTDGSGEFCDEFCKQDERFRVIHHEKNTGVSGPRNTGLRAAKGDYIYFMDSDDYIHVEAIEALVDAIKETGLELAVFDLQRTDSLNNDIHRPREKKPVEIVPAEKMVFEMLMCKVPLIWNVAWNKIYKRSLIEGIFFNDYYSIQDQDFNLRVYQRIEKAVFVPECLYWYYGNPKSLQRDDSFYPKKFYFNTMYRFRMLNYLSKKKLPDKKYRAWVLGYGYRTMPERRNVVKGSEYETKYKDITRDITRTTITEFLTSKYISFVKKLRFLFFWYCPRMANVYVRVYYGKKKREN